MPVVFNRLEPGKTGKTAAPSNKPATRTPQAGKAAKTKSKADAQKTQAIVAGVVLVLALIAIGWQLSGGFGGGGSAPREPASAQRSTAQTNPSGASPGQSVGPRQLPAGGNASLMDRGAESREDMPTSGGIN